MCSICGGSGWTETGPCRSCNGSTAGPHDAGLEAEIERLRGIIFEAGSTLNAALTYIPAGVQHDDAAEVIEKCANVPDREPSG